MEKIKLKYEIPNSKDGNDFGPATWNALHDIVDNIPCGGCREHGKKFMMFFHDMVNYNLGKPIHDKANFLYFINEISKMNKKPLILK